MSRYPYFFRADFVSFDQLPIQFFPYNDQGYVPFYRTENRFGEYVNFDDPVIDRCFFRDLDKPILAKDVFSQYQLEYLNDTVRKSEWVGRENHIYLHYTDWTIFSLPLRKRKRTRISKVFIFRLLHWERGSPRWKRFAML